MMMMKSSVKRGSILSYTTILSLSSWSYTEFKLGAILYAPTMMNHFVNNTYAALVAQNKYIVNNTTLYSMFSKYIYYKIVFSHII